MNITLINAFTQEGQGGNPAGVVLDATGLDYNQTQSIAAKVGGEISQPTTIDV